MWRLVPALALVACTAPDRSGPKDPSTDSPVATDSEATDSEATDPTDTDVGCLPRAYSTFLSANPVVEAASVGALDVDAAALLCDVVAELEADGVVTVAEPAASVACVEPDYCPTVALTDAERRQILAAKVGHALWLEVHGHVPWSLADYSSDELAGLFDPAELMTSGSFRYVVDHSPSDAYAYASAFVGADRAATVANLLGDLRTTDTRTSFVHGIGGRDPTDTAVRLDDAVNTWVNIGVQARVSRYGCHSMSRITLGLLRSVNIPGVQRNDASWFTAGHSSAVWPALAGGLPHGDDLYGATLRAVPSQLLLMPAADFTNAANTAVCGSNISCLARRQRARLAVAHPAKWTTDRCCDPTSYGHATCADYLGADYAGVLTAGEITTAAAGIACP